MTMFEAWGVEAAHAVIETERGLGNRFSECVKALLNEKKGSTTGELVAEYDVAIDALESAARDLLADAFDEKTTLSKAFPEFRNYKSAYRALLVKMGPEAATLDKFGPYHVKKKVAELNKGAKETKPDNKGPGTDDTPSGGGETTSTKGGKSPEHAGLGAGVQKKIDNAMTALSKMSEAEALQIAENFEAAAWKHLRTANKKTGVTTKAA